MLIDILLKQVSFDPDPLYVPMATDALGNIGSIEALPALLKTLQETDDPDVVSAVVRAIGKLGPDARKARPLLETLAADSPDVDRFPGNPEIRQYAQEALRRIG